LTDSHLQRQFTHLSRNSHKTGTTLTHTTLRMTTELTKLPAYIWPPDYCGLTVQIAVRKCRSVSGREADYTLKHLKRWTCYTCCIYNYTSLDHEYRLMATHPR